MDKLAIYSICTAPLAALAGVFVGAWLTHRAHLHQSPVPNLAESFLTLINIIPRKKPERAPKVPMPRQRA